MDKRTFLKLCSAVSTPVLSPLLAWAQGEALKNWAGNVTYGTERLTTATSLKSVQDFVREHNKFKVRGTRHCFNGIADSSDQFLSLKAMNEVVALDPDARTVTVEAGMSYGQLCPYLDSKGWALHNLASLPHISIVGACMTAPMAPERRTATWQLLSRHSNSSMRMVTSCSSHVSKMAIDSAARWWVWEGLEWSQKLRSIFSPVSRCSNTCTRTFPLKHLRVTSTLWNLPLTA